MVRIEHPAGGGCRIRRRLAFLIGGAPCQTVRASWPGNTCYRANTERREAMHFNLRGALGIAVPALLVQRPRGRCGGTPRDATTWQDTGLSATAVSASHVRRRHPRGRERYQCHQPVVRVRRDLVAARHTAEQRHPVRDHDQLFGYRHGTALDRRRRHRQSGNAEALEIPVALASGSIQASGRSVIPVNLVGAGRCEQLRHREVQRDQLGEKHASASPSRTCRPGWPQGTRC